MKINRTGKSILLGLSCILAVMALSACSGGASTAQEAQPLAQGTAAYRKISAEEAKAMIDSEEPVIILDVREQSEYDAGHIPDAVLLPSGSISGMAREALPDQNAKILVYCRSGNRSRTAANTLIGLGYTQVYDFGGIIDWPYDVVTN